MADVVKIVHKLEVNEKERQLLVIIFDQYISAVDRRAGRAKEPEIVEALGHAWDVAVALKKRVEELVK